MLQFPVLSAGANLKVTVDSARVTDPIVLFSNPSTTGFDGCQPAEALI